MARVVVTSADLRQAFAALQLPAGRPVLVHASLSAFGWVEGGAEAVVSALMQTWACVLAPAFTYKTMVTPECGPPGNGLTYGSDVVRNRLAEFFHPDMPVDRLIGAIPEALRRQAGARRSGHPILSFAGVGAESFLAAQTLAAPLRVIERLAAADGWVLLLGVDHTVNTSLHYAEKLAGRKQFLRWALTPQGVVACPGFPGCSDGFQALAPAVHSLARSRQVGNALIQAFPLRGLLSIALGILREDPLALLCDRSYCERCQQIRLDQSERRPGRR